MLLDLLDEIHDTYRRSNYYPCDSHQNTVTTIPWENCNLSGEEITCKKNEVIRTIVSSIISVFTENGWLKYVVFGL